jgi:hypothetical protein
MGSLGDQYEFDTFLEVKSVESQKIQQLIAEEENVFKGFFITKHQKKITKKLEKPNLLAYNVVIFNENGDILNKSYDYFISGWKTFEEGVKSANNFWKKNGVQIENEPNEIIAKKLSGLGVEYKPYQGADDDARVCTEPAAVLSLLDIYTPKSFKHIHIKMISDYIPCGTEEYRCNALLRNAFNGALKNKFEENSTFSFKILVSHLRD